MARGNDGNLLQHSVEAELMSRLFSAGEVGLHLVCTHSMEPFDAFRRSISESADQRARFEFWWSRALNANPPADEPAVLRAYRRTRLIERDRYPNSAEIAKALIGDRELAGTLVEKKNSTFHKLQARWRGTAMQVIHGSWRAAVEHLHAPRKLDRPWLFTMDPYTYAADESRDDGGLHPPDLELLYDPVRSWLFGGKPGAFCVFCYAMTGIVRDSFEAAVQNFNDRLGGKVVFVNIAAGQETHVGAVISLDAALLTAVAEQWNAFRNLSQ